MLIASDQAWEMKLGEVRRFAEERLPEETRAAFLPDFERFLAGAAPDEIAALDAETLYGATLALWQTVARRKPGTPCIRVYNPTMAEHGWASPHSIIEVINEDSPFLVDSMTVLLTERGLGVHALMHPVVDIARDAAGNRVSGAEAEAEGVERRAESIMQFQVDQIGGDDALAELETAVAATMADVRAATGDWRAMLERLAEATAAIGAVAGGADADARAEATAFLDWLGANHFTFLGCRRFSMGADGRPVAVEGSGLGLMRDPDYTVMRDAAGNTTHWTAEMAEMRADRDPVLILKANRRSTVHRGSHFDVIAVADYAEDGTLKGEQIFVGLFTSAAYNRSPHTIPLLREKIGRVIARAGLDPRSHDGKALDNVLEKYPRDELFQSTDEQLFTNARGVLQLVTRPRTRFFLRTDRFGRFVSCLVYVPRERYSTDLRRRLGEIVCAAMNGRVASWEPSFDMEALARVHYVVALTDGMPVDLDIARIEAEIVEATRIWADRLSEALVDRHGEHEGQRLHRRYGLAFRAAYRENVPVAVAVGDVDKLNALSEDAPLGLHFYRRLEDPQTLVRFKIFHYRKSVALSDCMPVLEHMGFRVLAEQPHKMKVDGVNHWIHDFQMRAHPGDAVDLPKLRTKLEAAFAAIWAGEVDDDPLNRLTLGSGIGHGAVDVLRAYSRFLRQARIPFSTTYIEDALAEQPAIARMLVGLFMARFDPSTGADRAAREADSATRAAEIEAALDQVPSLDVDRILRRILNAILSTLRTNAFQPGADGRPKAYVSFKFDCAALDDLPLPRPWREIFVYAPWVEGVHLRGGPVARGGLRWSDRKEDYRTEVLGLVKAQQVKNAVIVPVGSKGGFLPKKLPAGGSREEIQTEAIRCYRTFLSGLLDITDNLLQGAVAPPADVVRFDDDDPYLVVAADKGTATFSDIANALARDYGFWLDDAFASGGSNGYDHKGMGITAKGGWEAVKRHFREMGHDTQSEPFTVIGCGDMSGDVFGNGMLLSDQIKLVAAFDHRDIFIDPNPDPVTTFLERQRLFAMGRSSWQDYDTALISAGGGVFPRSAKSVALTPEIRALTGLSEDKVAPNTLINALLKSQCDLIWFGGIGTYIKAPEETALDVGDRANDAIRVDAGEVRARVVGEGANLGVTQRGRIALSRGGVRINTDAVDNSAGVDCSDHEVNIKIALGQVVAAGDMTEKQRNQLLAEMTDRVSELVLATNYAQTRAITLAETRAVMRFEDHLRLMRGLEARGLLNREVELLPSEEEIAERRARGEGLSRPEIAVLLAYAKLTLFDEVVASALPDDPYLDGWLIGYFPEALSGPHAGAIREHRLRREIIATVAANMAVNEGGLTLVNRVREETGSSVGEIVEAFVVAREVIDAGSLIAGIDALDNQVDAGLQTELYLGIAQAVASKMTAVLTRPAELGAGALIERYRPGVTAVVEGLGEMLSDYSKDLLDGEVARLVEAGLPEELARRLAALDFSGGLLDVVDVAVSQERDVAQVAETYYAVGARFGLDWLRTEARGLETADHWEQVAVSRLIGDLRAQQSQIAAAALGLAGCDSSIDRGRACIEAWAGAKAEEARRADQLVAELKSGDGLTVSKLAVAASQFRAVVAG
ncbi:MAG: NAD-glutamate dehydrogenase [Pseudomonadota bacterium]